MASDIVVVDASLVLKWQLDDEDSVSQADALKTDYCGSVSRLAIAPGLLTFEITNGILVASRRNRIGRDRAAKALEHLLSVPVQLRDVEARAALEIAMAFGISAYDAAYLALAEAEECDLWTGDRSLCAAMKGKSERVRWIGEYTHAARS